MLMWKIEIITWEIVAPDIYNIYNFFTTLFLESFLSELNFVF